MDEDDDIELHKSIEIQIDPHMRTSNYSVYSGLSGAFQEAYLEDS